MSSFGNGSIPGRIWRNRTGWEIPIEDYDYESVQNAGAILQRMQQSYGLAYRPGIIEGASITTGTNTISVSKLAYMDVYGQYGVTTDTEVISVSTSDIGKYVCISYSSVESNPQPSIIMGTVDYMYSGYQNVFSLQTTPGVTHTKICKIENVSGGVVTYSTTPGDQSDRSRDEWAIKSPWQSIPITSVMSSSISGETEDDMLTIGATERLTIFDEINYIKSVINMYITGGSAYAGGWDDVTQTTGEPNPPSSVTYTTGVVDDIRYNETTYLSSSEGQSLIGYIKLAWTAPTEPPTIAKYEIKLVPLTKVGETDVEISDFETSVITETATTGYTIHNLPVGVKYNVYIRSISVIGWRSSWVQATSTAQVIGVQYEPLAPSGTLTINQLKNGFRVSWNSVLDAGSTQTYGYLLLAHEGSEPSLSTLEDRIGYFTDTTATVQWAYTDEEIFFSLYSVGPARNVSSSCISTSAFMTTEIGNLNVDDVSKIKKLTNIPAKGIDLQVLEDVAATNISKRGRSTGSPYVASTKMPVVVRIEYTIPAGGWTSGDYATLDKIPVDLKNFSITEATFYQLDILGNSDFSNTKIQVGQSAIDWVEITLANTDSGAGDEDLDANTGELPSDVLSGTNKLEIRLTAVGSVTAADVLKGYLHFWVTEE